MSKPTRFEIEKNPFSNACGIADHQLITAPTNAAVFPKEKRPGIGALFEEGLEHSFGSGRQKRRSHPGRHNPELM